MLDHGRKRGVGAHAALAGEYLRQPVAELMTKERLITVTRDVSREDAKRLLHQNRIEKLLVVNEDYHC
ncbi:MAG TPA: IMP dehydrogenase, partial [Luteimonas sp.]|nr:IMP dehydrogenase [Luteimonas sp.]